MESIKALRKAAVENCVILSGQEEFKGMTRKQIFNSFVLKVKNPEYLAPLEMYRRIYNMTTQAIKPPSTIQHPINIYRQLITLRNEAKEIDSFEEISRNINKVVAIYREHEEQVNTKITQQDFKPVLGIDFNTWAHDVQYNIEKVYHEVKSRFYDLHWDKFGYNAY